MFGPDFFFYWLDFTENKRRKKINFENEVTLGISNPDLKVKNNQQIAVYAGFKYVARI
jgi:hypothetical protein